MSRPHRSLGERTPSEFASQYAASRVLTATETSRRLTLGLAQKYWSDQALQTCATLTIQLGQKIGQASPTLDLFCRYQRRCRRTADVIPPECFAP
jgi:hypothetical protein